MFSDPLFILVAIACLAVLVVLTIGIVGFSRGSEWNRKHANKIMRLRIALQFVAIIFILIFIYFRGGN